MAIAAVAPIITADQTSAATSLTAPVSANTGTGTRLILAIACNNGANVTSVTDTQGNTYASDCTPTSGSGVNSHLYSCLLTHPLTLTGNGGAPDTITVNISTSGKTEIAGAEYSGIATSSYVEASSFAGGGSLTSATTTSSRSLTPAAATSQLIAAVATASGTATGIVDTQGNYTQRVWSGSNALMDDLNNTGTTAIFGTFTWTGSSHWSTVGVVYVAATGTAHTGSASLAATATLIAAGVIAHTGSVTLAATATLSATPSVTHAHSATLSATWGLTATGSVAHRRSVTLTATAGMTAAGEVIRPGELHVWLPTTVDLQPHPVTAAMLAHAPAAAVNPNPVPAAVLDPHATTVVLDG